MKDSEIIELYFAREELAIEETHNKYGAYCYAISQNILSTKEDVEECMSDTYYKAWTSIPPLRPNNLKAWLGRVVRNISFNLWKKNHTKKRYPDMEVLMNELEECIPAYQDVESQIEADELGNIISHWLRTIEEKDRRLFIQRYFEGIKVKEIAEKENILPSKISKRLLRLRTQLKEVLEKEEVML